MVYGNVKFTPKIAGSVIPRKAERAAGKARAFNLGFLVLTPTATVAAPCAVIAAVMIALNGLAPVFATNCDSKQVEDMVYT